ncbi:MAG: hypothetical protein ACHWZW_08360 [Spirulina sp.]
MSHPLPALEFDDSSPRFSWAFPEPEVVGPWTSSPFAEAPGEGALAVPSLGSALESALAAVAVSSPWAFAHAMALVQWLQNYTPSSAAPLDQVQGWLEAFYHACEAELWELAGAIAQAQTKTGQPLYQQLGQWGHCREQVELCEALLPHIAEPLQGELRQLAGDGWRHLGHYDTARHHYEALLQESLAHGDRRQILKARLGVVHLAMDAAFYHRAIPQWLALLPEAEALGDAATIVDILRQLALAYGYTGRSGRSMALLQRALDLLQAHGLSDLEVPTLQVLIKVYEWRGQTQQTLAHLNRLLSVAQANQDLALEAEVYTRLARASFCGGQVSEAIAHSTQSLTLYRQIHYIDLEIIALNDLGTFYAYGLGQLSTALDYFRQAQALSRQLGIVGFLALLTANQAYCYALLGQQDLALQTSETALTLVSQDDVTDDLRMVAYAVLGRVHWVEGRYFNALALVGQALWMAPPWRSVNGKLVLAKTWETLLQWPQQWWQAQFGRN